MIGELKLCCMLVCVAGVVAVDVAVGGMFSTDIGLL